MSELRTLPITIAQEEIEQFCQRHQIRKLSTIARANRVFGDKVNGLIVGYIGVFRDFCKKREQFTVPHPVAASQKATLPYNRKPPSSMN